MFLTSSKPIIELSSSFTLVGKMVAQQAASNGISYTNNIASYKRANIHFYTKHFTSTEHQVESSIS